MSATFKRVFFSSKLLKKTYHSIITHNFCKIYPGKGDPTNKLYWITGYRSLCNFATIVIFTLHKLLALNKPGCGDKPVYVLLEAKKNVQNEKLRFEWTVRLCSLCASTHCNCSVLLKGWTCLGREVSCRECRESNETRKLLESFCKDFVAVGLVQNIVIPYLLSRSYFNCATTCARH